MADIFISYAHADDEVPTGATKGWVTTLGDELKKILRRKVGGPGASIFMDHQLAANESHAEVLLRELRESRVLLVVMSAGYESSFWCKRELESFVASGRVRGAANNVFIIELEPDVSRRWWDASLRHVNTIPFWRREFDKPEPRLLGYPVPKLDEDNPYWTKLNELAHAIADYLRRAAEAAPRERSSVLLGETTEDLLDERDGVAAYLAQQGVDVIPARPYPRESRAAFIEAFTHDLGRADVFAQLLGPREGRRPPDGDASFVVLQAMAAAHTRTQGGLRVVQWRTAGVEPDQVVASPYRTLVTGVPAGSLEEFKREVAAALRAPAAPARSMAAVAGAQAPQNGATRSASDELCVYVNADQVDRSVAERVSEVLSPLGVAAVIAPAPETRQSPDEIRRVQQEQLADCDGVLLVYGNTPETWLQSQFAVARRVVGLRRRGVWGAVLDAAPAGRPAPPIRSQSLINLDCRGGLDSDLLAHFVAALRGGSAPAYA